MNTKELIEKTSTVKTTAVFSKSTSDRYALTMEWDSSKESAVLGSKRKVFFPILAFSDSFLIVVEKLSQTLDLSQNTRD